MTSGQPRSPGCFAPHHMPWQEESGSLEVRGPHRPGVAGTGASGPRSPHCAGCAVTSPGRPARRSAPASPWGSLSHFPRPVSPERLSPRTQTAVHLPAPRSRRPASFPLDTVATVLLTRSCLRSLKVSPCVPGCSLGPQAVACSRHAAPMCWTERACHSCPEPSSEIASEGLRSKANPKSNRVCLSGSSS